MEAKKKRIGFTLNRRNMTLSLMVVTLMVATFFAGSIWVPSAQLQHRDPIASYNLYITIQDPTGVYDYKTGNLITNGGENFDRDVIHFGNDTGQTDWFSIGNATVAVTLTQLTTECAANGLARKVFDSEAGWMNGTDYAANKTATWMVTGLGDGNYVWVNAVGMHWESAGDGNLYAAAYITDGSYHQLMDTANVTATWVYTRDDN